MLLDGPKLDFTELIDAMRNACKAAGHESITDEQLREGLARYVNDLRLGKMTAAEFCQQLLKSPEH